MEGFVINDNEGFQITFKNGVTVSVQFGAGNYCTNKTSFASDNKGRKCGNAEVAIWNKVGDWITQEYDHDLSDVVIGYVKPDEVVKIIAWAQAYNGDEHHA